MLLIELKPNVWINPQHVIHVYRAFHATWLVYMTNGDEISISDEEFNNSLIQHVHEVRRQVRDQECHANTTPNTNATDQPTAAKPPAETATGYIEKGYN